MRLTRIALTIAALMLLTLVATACGGDDASSSAPEAPSGGQDTAPAVSTLDEIIAQAKEEGELVINNDDFADPRKYPGFFEKYPWLKVKPAGGPSSTSEMVARMTPEVKAGKVSTFDIVFWDESSVGVMNDIGGLQKPMAPLPHLADFYDGAVAFDGIFVGAWMNPRVQAVYNTDLVDPEDVPTGWDDFLDPAFQQKYKGKTLVSRSAEELPARMAWLFQDAQGVWDWDRAFEITRGFLATEPLLGTGYSIKQLTAGDVAMAFYFPPSSPAREALKGAPIALAAFPFHPGTWRGFSIPARAPHPAAAWLFLDYYSSPEGQRAYNESVGAQLPANKKAEVVGNAAWVVGQGVGFDTAKVITAEESTAVNSPEALEKSETFWFEQFGFEG